MVENDFKMGREFEIFLNIPYRYLYETFGQKLLIFRYFFQFYKYYVSIIVIQKKKAFQILNLLVIKGFETLNNS